MAQPSITVQPSATTTYTVVTSGNTTCQSDVTVSVNQRDFVTIDSTACDSIQWAGNWLTSTDIYLDTLQNIAGCDSIVTLNLIINQSTFDLLTECDSLTQMELLYTASNNTATHTLTAANGCDSIVTLNLTINNSFEHHQNITVCDSLIWDNGVTYTQSGNILHSLQTISGCDSIITLNLTVNYTSSSTDVITACDSYTWINGITYTSNNNTATYTYNNNLNSGISFVVNSPSNIYGNYHLQQQQILVLAQQVGH